MLSLVRKIMKYGALHTVPLIKTTGLTMASRLFKDTGDLKAVLVGRVTNITVSGGTTSYIVTWYTHNSRTVQSTDVFHYTIHESRGFWVTTLATKNVQVEVQS